MRAEPVRRRDDPRGVGAAAGVHAGEQLVVEGGVGVAAAEAGRRRPARGGGAALSPGRRGVGRHLLPCSSGSQRVRLLLLRPIPHRATGRIIFLLLAPQGPCRRAVAAWTHLWHVSTCPAPPAVRCGTCWDRTSCCCSFFRHSTCAAHAARRVCACRWLVRCCCRRCRASASCGTSSCR